MSIHTCRDYPTDPNCTCYSQTKEQIHHYRQFHNAKQNYNCCDTVYMNPAEIREAAKSKDPAEGCCYTLTSAVQYLKYINDNNLTNCDYSQYFGGFTNETQITSYMLANNRELYDNAEVNFKIYQTYFCQPDTLGSGTGTSPPIPVFSDHQVSCPATQIPYVLSYKTELDNSPFPQYTYICNTSQNFNQVNLSNGPLNYETYNFYNTNNIPCVTNSCATNYESGNYNNLANSGPVYQGKKPKNDETLLGVGIALLILVIIIYGAIGYYMFEETRNSKTPIPKKGK